MAKSDNPFRYFHSSPELIREVVRLYVRFPLSLRNVEDLLSGRGFDLCHETVRWFCQGKLPPLIANCYRAHMHRYKPRPASPFRYFHSSPELIRQVVMLYVRFPLSLRNVEDLLFERGYDLCHETVRLWWNRFGPMFAGEIRRKRVRQFSDRREVYK